MSQLNQYRFIDIIRTLTGNAGGAVSPDGAGNIDITGGTGITITGTPAANSLEAALAATVAMSYITDAGTATPAANVLNVLGGTNINTVGATDDLTINLDDEITLTTINATTVNATTLRTTSTADSYLSIVDETISVLGTDADIDLYITAKGTGHVIIDDLNVSGLTSGTVRASATGDISSLADGADGFLLIGKTGDVPIWATLTDGNNITCTEGANSISIAVTGTSNHAVQIGNGTNSLSSLPVGVYGEIISAVTGADPVWDSTPYISGDLSLGANLYLLNTTASIGQILVGGVRRFHTYGPAAATGNIFLGYNSGNFTLVPGNGGNNGLGSTTFNSLTTGNYNNALGNNALDTCSSGSSNLGLGRNALTALTTSSNNVAAGDQVLSSLVTGVNNVAIGVSGAASGSQYTGAESSNVLLSNIGTTGESNKIRIGTDGAGVGQQNACYVAGIYGVTPAGTKNIAYIDSNHQLGSVAAIEVSNGGTGLATLTDHSVLVGSGVGAITPLTAGTDGQVLVGSVGADPVFASITSTGSTIEITEGAGTLNIESSGAVNSFSGFREWDGAGPYYDDTTLGSFTVSQSGNGYINGVLVSWAAPQTVAGLTAGNTYFIYMDATGTIDNTTVYTELLYQDNIMLFEVLRDSTAPTNIQLTVKNNQPYQMAAITTDYLQGVIGPVISNSSLGANIVLNGTQKIEISGADYLADQGLKTDIPDSGGAGVTWEQYFTDGTGKWALNTSSDTFTALYNNAGTPAALTAGKFGVYRLYVAKDNLNVTTPTYIAVMNIAEYDNLVDAQTAIADGDTSHATAELDALEIAQLGHIIFSEATTAIVSVIISKETLRSVISTSGTNQASLVLNNVASFAGILSSADTTVQSALNTLDSWGAGTTDHAVLIGNGTGNAIGSLGVGTDGQVLLGSSAADPVFATISSTGTIAFTPGAGTLAMDCRAATDALTGVVELATDAESIAGGAGSVAIIPTSLKAKLGVQTSHGLPYGAGDAAAIAWTAEPTHGQFLVGDTGNIPQLATLTAGSGVIVTNAAHSITVAGNDSLLTSTGFESWTGAGAYYDDTTLGEFEILRGGTGYIKGIPVSWSGPQTTVGMTAGNIYWIYIDDTGTIGKTDTRSDATFEDYIVLYKCLRDSTPVTNNQHSVKNNYPYTSPVDFSRYIAKNLGSIIENSGANITLNGTQGIQINGADVLSAASLSTTIPDSGGVAELWHKYYTTAAGKWAEQNHTDTFTGYYNNGGTLTVLAAGKFGVYTLYVAQDDINAATPNYVAVLGDAQYNNLALAQTALANGDNAIATNELYYLNMAQLGTIIYSESTTAIVQVNIDRSSVRSSTITAGSNVASLISTVVTNFDGILSAADTNVQAAFETIDDWGKTTTDHAVLIGNGTGNAIGSLGVGTDGQVLLGSSAADPVFATISSTGTIAFTPGAGTLALDCRAATDALTGVVELATDAESIAGTASTVVNCTSLKAKLGTQTDHGLLVGSGDTGAVTALTVGTSGQVLVGSSTADPVFASISAGTGITVTEGAGTLTLSSTKTTIKTESGTTDTWELSDAGKHILYSNASPISVTVPPNSSVAFPVGTVISFSQALAGQVTFSGATPPTLRSADSALTTVKIYSVGCAIKVATDEWYFGGDLEA